jgi:hypothetical protein
MQAQAEKHTIETRDESKRLLEISQFVGREHTKAIWR